MKEEWMHAKTNWWRAAAIVLAIVLIVAGVAINRDRAAGRIVAEQFAELEGAILRAATEVGEIGDGVGRIPEGLERSLGLLDGIVNGVDRVKEYASVLEDTIVSLASRSGGVDEALAELADEIRFHTGSDSGDKGSSAGGD